MFDRRALLKASVAASTFGFPFLGSFRVLARPFSCADVELEKSLGNEDFWRVVRQHFLIKDGFYLNNGTWGCAPRPVFDAVVEHMLGVEEVFHDPGLDMDELRTAVGRFINAKPEEVAITRNTTEGMNFTAHGLPLKRGDEILTTDQEHVGGLCCWQLKAKRNNLKLRQLPIPMPAESADEILNIFNDAISRRTRVISFSHVNFTTGCTMPVKQLCRLARDKGIISVVDGAHPPGMMVVDVRDMGCDFYASSSHKWLCAPKGTGILYLRDEIQDQVWTTIASSGWDDMQLRAARFDTVGTTNRSLKYGLGEAIEFQTTIGKERIQRRVRQLNQYAKEQAAQIPKVKLYTSMKPELSSGAFSFKMDGNTNDEIAEILRREKRIRVRLVNEYDYKLIRIGVIFS